MRRLFGLLGSVICYAPNEPPEGGGGGGNNPPPAKPEPFAVFPTKEAFQERLDRDTRAYLKEKYGLTEKQIDDQLKRAKELEDAEVERKKAQLSTEERLKEEAAEAGRKQAAAEAAAVEARREADVTSLCARKGFKNVEYAIYEAGRSKKTGAELEAHFDEMAKDEGKKNALGLAVPAPEIVPVPGTTAPVIPPGGIVPPAPAPPGGTPPGAVDVMSLSPQAFSAHLAAKVAGA